MRAAVRGAAQGSQNSPEAPPVLDAQGGQHRERLRHSTAQGRSRAGFVFRRMLDAWEYGSGSDYTYHPPAVSGSAVVAPSSTRFALPAAREPSPVPAPVPVTTLAADAARAVR